MRKVPNASNVRCFATIHDPKKNNLSYILAVNDKFRFINAKDIEDQKETFSTNGLTVYNLVINEHDDLIYAVMGS